MRDQLSFPSQQLECHWCCFPACSLLWGQEKRLGAVEQLVWLGSDIETELFLGFVWKRSSLFLSQFTMGGGEIEACPPLV